VVNFDIPLEPELYVKRLEMLDRGHPGAKVVNLACDRYLYGLPAVEQHIGAKLESRQVTEDLLRAEDKSAALAFEKPSSDRGHRGPHTGRLVPVGGPQARRDERPKGEERSGGNQERRREGGQGRDSRRRRGGRDEDRSPEIRQSIAELTGSAPLSAPRPDAGNRQQPKTSSDRGSSGRGKAEGRRGGGEGKNKGRDQRASSSRPASGRGNSQKSQRRGPAPQGHADANDNPYELPMEERMKRYREKYGQRLESSDQRPGKGGQNHEGKRPQAQDGHSKQQHGGAPRQGTNGQQSRRPQQGPRPAPQSPASGKPTVGKPAAGNPAKPQRQGFLGKIRGLFGK
jgi:ATP-dependent RNA helicase RhlB